jgi:hypothetical protein
VFRRLLISLLLIATAWGPQWCCCQFRNLLSENTSVAQDRGLARASCCQRARNDKQDHGAPTDHECPCKDRAGFAALFGGAAEVFQDLAAADDLCRLHCVDLTAHCHEILGPPGMTRTESPPGALRSGRQLLRLKQTLRC